MLIFFQPHKVCSSHPSVCGEWKELQARVLDLGEGVLSPVS